MAAHDRIFGSDLPTLDSDLVGEMVSVDGSGNGENIDNFKDDISQRAILDHHWDNNLSQANGDQDGRHSQVTMKESASAPTAIDDCGILYTKDDSTNTELFYKDDLTSGNETQITKETRINIDKFFWYISSLFDGFALVTGTLPFKNGAPYKYSTTVSYPSGYSGSNSVLLSSRFYRNALAPSNAWFPAFDYRDTIYYPSYTVVGGAEIRFGTSDIEISFDYALREQDYSFVIGKLK